MKHALYLSLCAVMFCTSNQHANRIYLANKNNTIVATLSDQALMHSKILSHLYKEEISPIPEQYLPSHRVQIIQIEELFPTKALSDTQYKALCATLNIVIVPLLHSLAKSKHDTTTKQVLVRQLRNLIQPDQEKLSPLATALSLKSEEDTLPYQWTLYAAQVLGIKAIAEAAECFIPSAHQSRFESPREQQ